MVFTRRLRPRIKSGRIRCTIRIWAAPRVKVGGHYALDDGSIVVDSIEPIALKKITHDLARESGFESVADLMRVARHGQGRKAFLVRFRYVPPGGWV